MADAGTSRVLGGAAIITVGVGTLNSFIKYKKPPSARFLVGSGAAYVILSALAEGEPELAKALGVAMMSTVILGDGGGVLSYFMGHEADTTAPKREAGPLDDNNEAPLENPAELTPDKPRLIHPISSVFNGWNGEEFTLDTIPLQPGY